MQIELTGRTRFAMRRRLFRRDVPQLQVEETRTFDHWSNHGGMIDVETVVRTDWRPATVADLLNLRKDHALEPAEVERLAATLEI